MNNETIEFLNSRKLSLNIFDKLLKHKPVLSDEWIEVFSLYVVSIPLFNKFMFICMLDSFDRRSDEFKWIVPIHIKMMNDEMYKKLFYEATVDHIVNHGEDLMNASMDYLVEQNWVRLPSKKSPYYRHFYTDDEDRNFDIEA